MSKPWDKLRRSAIRPGVWYASFGGTGGLRVEFVGPYVGGGVDGYELRIGGCDRGTICVGAEEARNLAGFFNELADQLEGK